MSFSPIPDYSFRSLTDVTPEFLKAHKISLLLLDLDNTLAPYDADLPSAEISDWCAEMADAGIELFFVSNSKKRGRVETFADELRVGFITAAGKPSPASITRAIQQKRKRPSGAALAGDQIFTDVLGANRAGVVSILVRPITFKPLTLPNLLRALRLCAEAPFRALCPAKIRRNRLG